MCKEQEQAAKHLLFDCPAIARERYFIFANLDKDTNTFVVAAQQHTPRIPHPNVRLYPHRQLGLNSALFVLLRLTNLYKIVGAEKRVVVIDSSLTCIESQSVADIRIFFRVVSTWVHAEHERRRKVHLELRLTFSTLRRSVSSQAMGLITRRGYSEVYSQSAFSGRILSVKCATSKSKTSKTLIHLWWLPSNTRRAFLTLMYGSILTDNWVKTLPFCVAHSKKFGLLLLL
ncbi:hypothetical protein J6590_066064 [Homalodisca vitripennis]|nr:hypothetical protein J6590_066064 [Homalodisca vitripennis]